MRAKIEHNWQDNTVSVWILEDSLSRLAVLDSSLEVFHDLPPSTADVPPPTLRLPVPAFEALVREAGTTTQASDATVEALRDTREIRDRLLTMVEKRWSE